MYIYKYKYININIIYSCNNTNQLLSFCSFLPHVVCWWTLCEISLCAPVKAPYSHHSRRYTLCLQGALPWI